MKIVSRREWGAAPPKSSPVKAIWGRGVPLWLHHTAGPTTQTPRQIQNFHQSKRPDAPDGWNDIGYSYLINEAGTVFEGRGFEVYGAHSKPVNHQPSVALIGDYRTRVPTDAQHRAVYALKDHLGAGPIKGHRDSWGTTCPGDAAYRKIVVGGPPKPPAKPKPTLRERLMAGFRKAGFGGKSAKQATDNFFRGRK